MFPSGFRVCLSASLQLLFSAVFWELHPWKKYLWSSHHVTSEVNETDQFPALTDTICGVLHLLDRETWNQPFCLLWEWERNLKTIYRWGNRAICCLVRKVGPTLFVTPWTIAHQAPLSMGSPRQEYWGGLLFPLQGIFPTQESNPGLIHGRWILYHCDAREVHQLSWES